MAKNTAEGNRERAKRHREQAAERGLVSVTVVVPTEAKPLLKTAAGLMTRKQDPLTPASAMRQAAGSNELPVLKGDQEARDFVATADLADYNLTKMQVVRLELRTIELEQALEAAKSEAEAAQELASNAWTEVTVAREMAFVANIDAEAAQVEAATAKDSKDKATKAAIHFKNKAIAATDRLEAVQKMPGVRGFLVRLLAKNALAEVEAEPEDQQENQQEALKAQTSE